MIVYTGVIFLFNFKKSLNLKKVAFSLIELMISLIVVSLVAAAFTPVITKKLKTSSIFGSSGGGNSVSANCQGKFDSDCKLCTKDLCVMCKKTCESGFMLEADSCKCNQIITINNCKVYSDYKTCETCEDGYFLVNNQCYKRTEINNCVKYYDYEDKCEKCDAGFELSLNKDYCRAKGCDEMFGAGCNSCSVTMCTGCNGLYSYNSGSCTKKKELNQEVCDALAGGANRVLYLSAVQNGAQAACVTKYNVGDTYIGGPEIASDAGISLKSYASDDTACSGQKCCWVGNNVARTSGPCSEGGNGDSEYSGCRRSLCNWEGANAACAYWNPSAGTKGKWRLPTSKELKMWADLKETLIRNKGKAGLQFCAYTGATVDGYTMCKDTRAQAFTKTKNNFYPYYVWGAESSSSKGNALNATNGYVFTGAESKFYPQSARCVLDETAFKEL